MKLRDIDKHKGWEMRHFGDGRRYQCLVVDAKGVPRFKTQESASPAGSGEEARRWIDKEIEDA